MSDLPSMRENIRDMVGDQNGERWGLDVTTRALKKAFTQVAIQSRFFTATQLFTIDSGYYLTPDDVFERAISHRSAWAIDPDTGENYQLEFKTVEWMFKNKGPGWEQETGEKIKYVVINRYNHDRLWFYPLLDLTATPSQDVFVNSVIIPFEITLVGTYEEDSTTVLDEDGAGFNTMIFDDAVEHYAAGLLLRNDIDIENRNKAKEEFVLYQNSLNMAMEIARTDQIGANYDDSGYNGMG